MKRIQSVALSIIILLATSFFFLWFFVTQPTTVKNQKDWVSNVDSENLKNHVKMLSNQLPARSDDVDKLGHSSEYIYNEFGKIASTLEYQTFLVQGIEYKNIVATFGPKYTGRMYVVGAHYDSHDGLPGADDNASGVAGLIELGRLFSLTPPPVTIQLAAYALEEQSYFGTGDMGSFHHAKSLRERSINVTLMISLEMIGYYTNESNSQDYPISFLQYFYSNIGDFIAVVGGLGESRLTRFFKKGMIQTTPLPVYSINAHPSLAGISYSDHYNFWQFDYSAIMITDTAFYRNKNYHTIDDTWDTLNYNKMSMVIEGVQQSLLLHMNEK